MTITVMPVRGLPDVVEGDDLAALIGATAAAAIKPGDAVVVTSKIVSKALGLRSLGPADEGTVRAETVRVVAERVVARPHGPGRVTQIVESAAGPVMAGAGVDSSNTGTAGRALLLPRDPDACARELRASLMALMRMPRTAPFAVVLSDTAGRPWRAGQVDFALGSAGLHPSIDHRGQRDADGRELAVTVRAVADEVAAAADLVKGKADAVPVAIVRGLPSAWFAEAAVGARTVVRTGASDWFALGHAEAVRAALGAPPGSDRAARVGVRAVGDEPLAERVARVVALSLLDDDDASADVEVDDLAKVATVSVASADDFRVGRLAERMRVAAASEDLAAEVCSAPDALGSALIRLTAP